MEAQLFDMFIAYTAIENENRQTKDMNRRLARGR